MSQDKTTPEDLIAEFHRVTGVRPGNVVYEAPLFVFKYPRTKLSEDRVPRAWLEKIIADERTGVWRAGSLGGCDIMTDEPQTTDCRVKEGHRYDGRGICVWCDAERQSDRLTVGEFVEAVERAYAHSHDPVPEKDSTDA